MTEICIMAQQRVKKSKVAILVMFLPIFFLFREKDSYSVQTSALPRRSSGVLASLNTNTVTESSKIPGWGSCDAPWEEYAVNLKKY